MRLAALAMTALLAGAAWAGAGEARADGPAYFSLFQQICLQHPRSPDDAEAEARALGFVDSGRYPSKDKGGSSTIVDLIKTVDGKVVVVGIDDDPGDDAGIRLSKCGLSIAGDAGALETDIRNWASAEPHVMDGMSIYLFTSPGDWTPMQNAPDEVYDRAVKSGDLRSVVYMAVPGGVSVVQMGYRKTP